MCMANINIFRVNSCLFTDDGSFIYDGTPLVKLSVDHVRTLSHKSRVLLRDVTHREPRSCTCLSTTISDPSASLKDPRRRSEEPSIRPARPTGCPAVGAEEHRIVWWRSPQGLSAYSCPLAIVGITDHDRPPSSERAQGNVYVLSLPQRLFFHCCSSCCTPSSLAHR